MDILNLLVEIKQNHADSDPLEVLDTMSDLLEQNDKELYFKVKKLKKSDKDGKVCFVSFDDWLTMGAKFKQVMENTVDPLFSSGVFFDLDSFIENWKNLRSHMSPKDIIVIKKSSGFYEVSMHGKDKNYMSKNYSHLSNSKVVSVLNKKKETVDVRG